MFFILFCTRLHLLPVMGRMGSERPGRWPKACRRKRFTGSTLPIVSCGRTSSIRTGSIVARGPTLLSTRSIVARGPTCSRRKRSFHGVGRALDAQDLPFHVVELPLDKSRTITNRSVCRVEKHKNSKAAALTECLTRWGQIYTKVYFLFVCVFSCFCLLCLEIWSGHIYTRGLHAYPHHCLCILRSVGWQPTLSPH